MKKDAIIAPAKTVDEYLARLPEAQMAALENLRQVIKTTAPMAMECISYQIPGYKYLGPLVYFAAFKNHCSLFGMSKKLLSVFEEELKPYRTAGTTIHFTPDNPLPAALVQRIVQLRIQDNEARHALKTRKTTKPKEPQS
jgi:uncharacterized protein YdhG (YjbR/CyaY superfamily)